MFVNILETLIFYYFIVCVVISCTQLKYINPSVSRQPRFNYTWAEISLFSALFAVFNFFCTQIAERKMNAWHGDRGNYLYSFLYQRENSLGLDFLFDIAHWFDVDFLFFLYATTFVCCVLSFWGIRRLKYPSILLLLFLFSTDYFFQTFSQLKQCYANAFALLFFVELFNKKSVKRDLLCIALALGVSLFHATGYLLFPVFLAFKFIEKNPVYFKFTLSAFVLIILFLKPFLYFFSTTFSSFLPYVSSKIILFFFEESTSVNDSISINFIKGIPFYFISILGFVKRRNLENVIPNYNNYMLMSILASVLYAMSIYSYWMFRFTSLFYMPVGILFSLILWHEKNSFDRFVAILVVLGSTFVVQIRHLVLSYINFGGII